VELRARSVDPARTTNNIRACLPATHEYRRINSLQRSGQIFVQVLSTRAPGWEAERPPRIIFAFRGARQRRKEGYGDGDADADADADADDDVCSTCPCPYTYTLREEGGGEG
jgi:hypothetical protein